MDKTCFHFLNECSMQCNNNGIAQTSLIQASMGDEFKKKWYSYSCLTIPVSRSMHAAKKLKYSLYSRRNLAFITKVLFGLLELCSNIVYGAIDP